MREILAELDQWCQQNEEIALATLVRVRGTAPLLPGARLCVTRSGKMAGSVSGGCVESDVFERAMLVLDSGQPVLASYGIADEVGFQVGLSCGGTIDVLIEAFRGGEVWQVIREAMAQRRPAALATAVAPGMLLGRKLTVMDDTTTVGSIDPDVDQQVAAETRRVLLDGGTHLLTLPWRGEEAVVFIEAFSPPLRLFILGATHTAQSLCRMAKGLGFQITVIDARGTYATSERFPEADEIVRAWPDEVFDEATLDPYSHIVILTHDPKFDIPALTRSLGSRARYIGVLGSRATHARREAQLRQAGFTDTNLARIRAPIGLDIGARTPDEIALAILAEMVAVRYGRDGRALAEKKAAIHGGK